MSAGPFSTPDPSRHAHIDWYLQQPPEHWTAEFAKNQMLNPYLADFAEPAPPDIEPPPAPPIRDRIDIMLAGLLALAALMGACGMWLIMLSWR